MTACDAQVAPVLAAQAAKLVSQARDTVSTAAEHCLGCRQESIRTAFLLCQGGEFAFVLLSLAAQLRVLPDELNRLLIIVVVLSMGLTPTLADLGRRMALQAADEEGEGVCILLQPDR